MLNDYLFNCDLQPIDDKKVIAEIKASPLPCVLWGAGEVAEKVFCILTNNGIEISDVLVDGVVSKHFHGYISLNFDQLIEKHKRFNVIMGHNRYDRIDSFVEKHSQVAKVFFFYNSFNWEEGFNIEYYKAHESDFQKAFELSEDGVAKNAYSQFINSRISANPRYITSDCVVNGYFNNDVMNTCENDSLLEIGAFNGNIVSLFNKETNGKYKKVIALEPDADNFKQLTANLLQLHDIELHRIGCWNKKTELNFCIDGTGKSNHIDETGKSVTTISVDTVDDILQGEAVSIINLFCQTGIMEILEGAKETIIEHKPKLIIGIGLRKEQSYQVPLFLKSLNVNYKFFYRFYGGVPSKFYLVAVQ